MLLRHPALDLRVRDNSGLSTLGEAVLTRNAKIATAMKQREPLVAEERNAEHMTPLHVSISMRDADAVDFLLKLGANANAEVRDTTARTPLTMAITSGLDAVVLPLLRAGADPSAVDRMSRWTPAHMAVNMGNVKVLDMLIGMRANLLAKDDRENTIVHAAVGCGQMEILQKLLSDERCAVLVMQPNTMGETPLHTLAKTPMAAEAARNMFSLLFGRMPQPRNVNIRDEKGNTPLYYACENKFTLLGVLFVRAGGNPALPNAEGKGEGG